MLTITSSARPPWKIIGTSVRRGATAIWPPAFSTCAARAIPTTNWYNECARRCRDKSPRTLGTKLLPMAAKRRMLRLFLDLGLGVRTVGPGDDLPAARHEQHRHPVVRRTKETAPARARRPWRRCARLEV